MPRLSDTMESGTIARWHKQEGDRIDKGDIIAEIETDKANMEMESFASGVLAKILVGEEQGINLVEVRGTGPGGRITKDDIVAYAKQETPARRPEQAPAAAQAEEAARSQPAGAASLRSPQPVEMSRMHQTIARRMTEAR